MKLLNSNDIIQAVFIYFLPVNIFQVCNFAVTDLMRSVYLTFCMHVSVKEFGLFSRFFVFFLFKSRNNSKKYIFCLFQEDCPFIVCMTYAFQTPDKLCFILDLMNGKFSDVRSNNGLVIKEPKL